MGEYEWFIGSGTPRSSSCSAGSSVITNAQCRPAVLKAFDALVTTRAVGSTVRYGTNVVPGRVSGPWISSAITRTPYDAVRSRSASSSPRVHTRPSGLCGLHSSIVRAPPAKARSRPSSSRPATSESGSVTTGTSSRPMTAMTSRKGG